MHSKLMKCCTVVLLLIDNTKMKRESKCFIPIAIQVSRLDRQDNLKNKIAFVFNPKYS